ncbi:hypothetical protein TNCT_432221 [Trichonephila clavata]|uniref:Uncharacterized protein n=1 Tax=Trichonephila clavata TaxID=2740835 RepID=A0A8X6G2Y7_TRICU|nr:hypothetical protein TNCT_432221 [Trichonephila clavata]
MREWQGGKKCAMQFAVPIDWRESINHVDNCYFCVTPPMNMGWFRKKKEHLQYPCISSAIQPIPHSADMPIHDSPKKYEIVKDYVEKKNSLDLRHSMIQISKQKF